MRAILTYHSIDASRSPISVDEGAFRRHVAWLAKGSVRVVGLAALSALDGPGDALAITFDDGFVNFGDVAWPLLREHGLPVTLFVVSGRAGTTNAWGDRPASSVPTLPLLDWDRLGRLAEEGVTLGAHTRTHPDLRNVGDDALADELEGCARDIAAHTGAAPATFAYPYGAVDARIARSAARSFSLACATELRLLAPDDDPLRLPRLDAFYLRDAGRLEAWGTPAFRSHLRLRAFARRVRQHTLAWFGSA